MICIPKLALEIRDISLLALLLLPRLDNIEFHSEDFAGLFPVWPIVEFALTPSGTSKIKRKTQYMCWDLALCGQILLVDKKAAIAPIKITNDTAEDLITDKSKIPSNFTKLGKWLMMSGGSWVFNKANSNVYACFRFKSTVPVKDMVMRVSFKFPASVALSYTRSRTRLWKWKTQRCPSSSATALIPWAFSLTLLRCWRKHTIASKQMGWSLRNLITWRYQNSPSNWMRHDCHHRPSKRTRTVITSKSKGKRCFTARWQRTRYLCFASLEDMPIIYG